MKSVPLAIRSGSRTPILSYIPETEEPQDEPLVASVRNVEPQVYLLLQNEAESRCSTTDQISRPWSKSKRPITSSLLAGIASYLPAIRRNSRRSWTGLRSDSKG